MVYATPVQKGLELSLDCITLSVTTSAGVPCQHQLAWHNVSEKNSALVLEFLLGTAAAIDMLSIASTRYLVWMYCSE